jgi:DNA-binding NtrC family response regulator
MVAALNEKTGPFSLAVSGEAESWLPALEEIVGPRFLVAYRVSGDRELIEVVREGLVDGAVLDDAAQWRMDMLHLLRLLRQVDRMLPVVVLTKRTDRRWLEDALRLAVFSVVVKPLELEELLRQIQRMMIRIDRMLREGP